MTEKVGNDEGAKDQQSTVVPPAKNPDYDPSDGEKDEELGDEEDIQEDKALPMDVIGDGIGCIKGFIRDRHTSVLICTMLYFLFGILYAAGVVQASGCAILCIIVAPFYITFAICSNSFKYIRSICLTETVMDYINLMYAARPEVKWHIQCYHHEKRTRYVTKFDYTSTYTSPSGQVTKTDHYKKVPEKYEVRVDTHSANGSLIYLDWEDASVHVKIDEIEQHQVTKVLINKTWIGDSGAIDQKQSFIAANDRDLEYDFNEELFIPGYHEHYLGLNDIEHRPFLLHWMWYIVFHITIVYSFPYLMYISSITDKVTVNVVKTIWTVDRDPEERRNVSGADNQASESSSKVRQHTKAKGLTKYFTCAGLVLYTICIAILVTFIVMRATKVECLDGYCPGEVFDTSKLGNGICDGGEHNTQAWGWDGGDCIVEGYQDCHIDHPWLVGDGSCCCSYPCIYVDEVWTEECGWDGGDCLHANHINDDPSYCPY